jgi:hypothetical protein
VRLEERDDLLQRVAVLGADSDEVALNGSLGLFLAVFDGLDDFAGLFLVMPCCSVTSWRTLDAAAG